MRNLFGNTREETNHSQRRTGFDQGPIDRRSAVDQREAQIERARPFLLQVFGTMSIGLLISALAAWWVANSPLFDTLFYSGSLLRYAIMFAPLIMVIYFSARFHKMSFSGASTTFGIYALVTGISLSFIFKIYDPAIIMQTFFITAGTFGGTAVFGLFTRIDFTKYGNYLYMALWGLILVSIVNLFLPGWSWLNFGISAAGVLIFTALTAYDVQTLLKLGNQLDPEQEGSKKLAVFGALQLYLDFINLFLFILRFVGMSRD